MMKKAIQLSLAFLLAFSMLFSTVSVGIAAPILESEWTFYDNGTTIIGTGATPKTNVTAETVTDMVYAEADGDGDGKAYKLGGNAYPHYATIKLTVEANKYYEASFYFYATAIGTNNSAFSDVIIAKDGAVKTDYTAEYCARLSRYYGYYTNKNSALIKIDETTSGFSANTWERITVPFYSGDQTEVLLAMRPATNTSTITYIDNIQLTEVAELAGAHDVISDATSFVYNMSNTTAFTRSDANKTGGTFAKDTTSFTAESDADGDGQVYTLSADCYAQYATVELPVAQGKNYQLTFQYNSAHLVSSAVFSDIRVAEFGAENAYTSEQNLAAISRDKKTGYLYNKNGVTVDTKIDITSGVKAGEWNEITINFYSKSLSKVLLVLRPTINVDGTKYPVYIDDVQLTEVDTFTGSERVVSDWTIYDNGTTVLGTGGTVRNADYGSSYSVVSDTLYTEADGDGDGEAYCFTGCSAQWPTAKIALTAKTYYTLSFHYYGTELDGYQWGPDGMFSDFILLKDGNAKNVATDHLGYIGRNDAYYNNKNGTQINVTDRINSDSIQANQWNQVTISFYSGDLTEALLAIRPTVATVFVDNITLTKVSTLSSANLFPSGWTVYQMGTTGTNDGSVEHTTAVISESTEKVHSTDIDSKSVVLESSCYAQYPTLPLTVEKNKYYTLQFYYYCDEVNNGQWDCGKIFSDIYVAEAGNTSLKNSAIAHATIATDGTVYKNGEAITVTGFTTSYPTVSAWNEVKVRFYSGENESVRFAVRPAISATQQPVYIDDITLTDDSVSTSYTSEAAIRAAGSVDGSVDKNGLRTYNAITADWLDETEANIVEYGSIVIRQGYMNTKFADKTAPDLDMLSLVGKGVGLGVSYRAENASTPTSDIAGHTGAKNTHWERGNTDGIFAANIFTSYLTGIDAANYGEEYLVRVYAIAEDGTVYYGDTASVSIYKVAQAMDLKFTGEGSLGESEANDIAAFNAFVGADPTAYADWCGEGKTGQLYAALTASAE